MKIPVCGRVAEIAHHFRGTKIERRRFVTRVEIEPLSGPQR
jgi:hypothetical protein